MAAAIYNKLTDSKDADSVGTYTGAPEEPEGQILSNLFKTPDFFEIMEKNGMYVRDNRTKRLQPSMLDAYDVIVSMAQEPYRPDFLKKAKKVIWWDVTDPASVNKKVAKDTYEKIDKLVRDLIYQK